VASQGINGFLWIIFNVTDAAASLDYSFLIDEKWNGDLELEAQQRFIIFHYMTVQA
jgi:hypothetical protein